MKNFEKHTPALTITRTELYDLSMLEEMDDNEYLIEMLSILLKETPESLKEMKKASEAGKTERVYQTAHKIKGSAGVIQAKKLIELLEKIEAVAKKGTAGNELAGLVEHAAQQYGLIENMLRTHLEEFK